MNLCNLETGVLSDFYPPGLLLWTSKIRSPIHPATNRYRKI